MSTKIQVRRGTDAQRMAVVLADGEPAFTLDTKKFYIGDGLTPGGIEIGAGGTGGGTGGGTTVGPADDVNLGTVKLSITPINPLAPVAVGDNDPRMSDARIPLAHTHTEYEPADPAIQAHIADRTTNPHGITAAMISAQPVLGYVPENVANKNAANGYAGLDGAGKISPSQLPDIAITDTFVVASQAAQTAPELNAQIGDIAIRTDLNKTFILKSAPHTTFANWQELLMPAGGGGSVTLLSALSDVAVAATPTNGDALTYNASSGKWVNSTIPVLTSNQSAALAGTYGTPSALNKYVTDTDSRMTDARNPLAHTHGITEINNILISSPTNGQVLSYNSTSGKWVNAAATGGITNLDSLTDVTITGAVSGQIISFNGSAWVNTTHAHSLNSLSNVAITSPTNGQALVYDSASGNWKPGTVASGSASVSTLTDATITSPTNGQVLTYNGTKWVNQTPAAGGGGSSSTRYQIHAGLSGGTPSYVVATGAGVTLTYSGTYNEIATLNVPAGVTVLSATISFLASALPALASTLQVNFSQNTALVGDSSDQTLMSPPTCQSWAMSGSYAVKTTATYALGKGYVTVGGLTQSIPFTIKLVF